MSAVTPHFIKKLSNGVERVVSYLPDGVLGQTSCLAQLGLLTQRGAGGWAVGHLLPRPVGLRGSSSSRLLWQAGQHPGVRVGKLRVRGGLWLSLSKGCSLRILKVFPVERS